MRRLLVFGVLAGLALPAGAAAATLNEVPFTVRLRPDRPRRVRWVVVRAGSIDRRGSPHVLVPVG